MNKQKGIYAVTVVRYATMYVEAFTSDAAMRIAEKYKDDVDDFDFGLDNEVDSCENYTTDLEDVDAEHIYTEEGRVSLSSYEEIMRNKLSNSETFLNDGLEKEFDLFDYVSTDMFRVALHGVYHEGGMKAASDGCILIEVSEKYKKSAEGKMKDKDGKTIKGEFPSYKRLFPEGDAEKTFTLKDEDIEKVKTFVKKMRGKKFVSWNPLWRVRIGGLLITAKNFFLLIRAMKYIGADVIHIYMDGGGKFYSEGDKGRVLVMPTMYYKEEEKIIEL
jgi:hypothetical protein